MVFIFLFYLQSIINVEHQYILSFEELTSKFDITYCQTENLFSNCLWLLSDANQEIITFILINLTLQTTDLLIQEDSTVLLE